MLTTAPVSGARVLPVTYTRTPTARVPMYVTFAWGCGRDRASPVGGSSTPSASVRIEAAVPRRPPEGAPSIHSAEEREEV